MRWKNRCPAVVRAMVPTYGGERLAVIDRCYYEADEVHEHWSKQSSFTGPWEVLDQPAQGGANHTTTTNDSPVPSLPYSPAG